MGVTLPRVAKGGARSAGKRTARSRSDAQKLPAVTAADKLPPSTREAGPWKRVAVWFVGVISAALIPFVWVYESTSPSESDPSIYRMLGSGDIYLISVIVIFAGLTEIALLFRKLSEKNDLNVALLVLGGIFAVLVCAARYAGASTAVDAGRSAPNSVAYWSLLAFAFAAVHSSFCVILAAGAE